MKKNPFLLVAGITTLAVFLWLWLSPPRFWLNLVKRVDSSDPVAAGERLVEQYGCRQCHKILGQGALKAPALDGVTQRLDDQALYRWLSNPNAVARGTAMPNFRLSDAEIFAIIAYLQSIE
jgi:cytochrome c2